MESPEKFLNDLQLNTFIAALKFHSKENGSIVFIHSDNQDIWKNVINKQLLFSVNHRFILRPVIQHHLKEQLLTRNNNAQNSSQKYQGLHFINIDAHQKKAA